MPTTDPGGALIPHVVLRRSVVTNSAGQPVAGGRRVAAVRSRNKRNPRGPRRIVSGYRHNPAYPPANPRGAAPRRGVPVERSAPPVGHTHRQRPWFPTSPPRALVLSRSGACRFRIGDPVAPHDAASPASPRPTARVASSAPPAPTSSPYRAAAPSAPPSRCVTRPRNTPVRSRATGSAPVPRSASARGCARGSVLPPAGGSPSPGCTRSSTRALNRFGECTGSLTLAARSPS